MVDDKGPDVMRFIHKAKKISCVRLVHCGDNCFIQLGQRVVCNGMRILSRTEIEMILKMLV